MNDAPVIVDVWVAPLEVPPPLLASLLAGLTNDERARSERFRSERDVRRFSVARGWLRQVLAAELGIAAHEVELPAGPGKPRLADGRRPCFNLSRAHELCLVAVSAAEVGVDLEHESRAAPAMDGVGVACTRREQAVLDRLPPGERHRTFARWWTAKEAYLKGIGTGLTVAPDRVEVGRNGEVCRDGAATGWYARHLSPGPGYVGAVAVRNASLQTRVRAAADLMALPGARR